MGGPTAAAQVVARVHDGIAELTLNRPRALNSLNLEMVRVLHDHYRAWVTPDSGVRAVLLMGAGGKVRAGPAALPPPPAPDHEGCSSVFPP